MQIDPHADRSMRATARRRPVRRPWLPLLSAVASFALMASLSTETWIRLVIWMTIGLLLYAAYGYRHSAIRQQAAGEGS